ncbi:MAG TPA: metalloregulator ArsR/SmtB family transcription factor [Thermoanaerobaculia bacterium]|nr:metalloregulator ArsR/SmtB family transcription factor [Thermoanaerobaculia bacterium]
MTAPARSLDAQLPAQRQLLARRFYALGDEIRLGILDLLRGGERCVCELTACLGLAQSRLSFHLKVLKDAGLISHRRQGRWSYYALDPEAFREIEEFLNRVPPAAVPCCGQPEPLGGGGAGCCADDAGAPDVMAIGRTQGSGPAFSRKEQR